MELSDKITLYKIDTGAKVSAMNEQTFNSMTPSAPLNTPSKLLHRPSRQPLDTLGKYYSFACSQRQIYYTRSVRDSKVNP